MNYSSVGFVSAATALLVDGRTDETDIGSWQI